MSVKKQLLCYFFIFLLLIMLPFLFLPKIFGELRLDYAKKEAENQANVFQSELAMTMARNQNVADKLAFFFEHYDGKLTKELVAEHLEQHIGNPEFNGVYGGSVSFIPDKTPFGKYAPYCYRKKDGDGYKLTSMDLSSDEYNYVTKSWYKSSINAGGIAVWSYPYDDAFAGNELMITYSKPIVRNGTIIAFVTIDVLIDRFREMLLFDYVRNEKYCFVLTPDGNAIGLPGDPDSMSKFYEYMDSHYSSDSLITFKTALKDWNMIFIANQRNKSVNKPNIFDMKDDFFEKDNRYRAFIAKDLFIGKSSVYSIVPMRTPCSLLITVTSEAKLLPHLTRVQRGVSIFMLILITAFFLIFYFSGKAAEPFEQLVIQTEEFSGGNFEHRIDLKNESAGVFLKPSKEATKLVESFNSMGEKLRKSFGELEDTRQEILLKLMRASEYKDVDTGQHLKRISAYCTVIAEKLGFSDFQVKMLADASMMHDVGKIGIPDNVLLKPGKLTVEEFEIMKTHTKVGAGILSGSQSILLQMAEKIAASHHEKWNGKGYPLGLSGEDIPIEGRITAVCDIFDALISKRPYKEPWTFESALDYIKNESGISLDPDIVAVFLDSKDEIHQIVKKLN